MNKLTECKKSTKGVIADLKGEDRFLGRVISMGLTVGCPVEVIQNAGKLPVLIYARDTMISIAKNEAEKIFVEESR